MHSPNQQFQMLPISVLGLLAVAGAALAGGIWYGVSERTRQEDLRQAEMREFHADLLDRVELLAEKSGMLTSADLCPITFRLRLGKGLTVPSADYLTSAHLVGPDAEHYPTRSNSRLDFGLLPPATYRLYLATELYELEHEFEVLPGVPVDRVVLCPNADPPGLKADVDVDWSGLDATDEIVTMCDIEPDAPATDQWAWRPVTTTCVRVVANGALDALHEKAVSVVVDDADADDVQLTGVAPFRFCRLRAIHVYRKDPTSNAGLVRIACCVFDDTTDQSRRQVDVLDEPAADSQVLTIVCPEPAPRYEVPVNIPSVLEIAAPVEFVTALEMVLEDGIRPSRLDQVVRSATDAAVVSAGRY